MTPPAWHAHAQRTLEREQRDYEKPYVAGPMEGQLFHRTDLGQTFIFEKGEWKPWRELP